MLEKLWLTALYFRHVSCQERLNSGSIFLIATNGTLKVLASAQLDKHRLDWQIKLPFQLSFHVPQVTKYEQHQHSLIQHTYPRWYNTIIDTGERIQFHGMFHWNTVSCHSYHKDNKSCQGNTSVKIRHIFLVFAVVYFCCDSFNSTYVVRKRCHRSWHHVKSTRKFPYIYTDLVVSCYLGGQAMRKVHAQNVPFWHKQ